MRLEWFTKAGRVYCRASRPTGFGPDASRSQSVPVENFHPARDIPLLAETTPAMLDRSFNALFSTRGRHP